MPPRTATVQPPVTVPAAGMRVIRFSLFFTTAFILTAVYLTLVLIHCAGALDGHDALLSAAAVLLPTWLGFTWVHRRTPLLSAVPLLVALSVTTATGSAVWLPALYLLGLMLLSLPLGPARTFALTLSTALMTSSAMMISRQLGSPQAGMALMFVPLLCSLVLWHPKVRGPVQRWMNGPGQQAVAVTLAALTLIMAVSL